MRDSPVIYLTATSHLAMPALHSQVLFSLELPQLNFIAVSFTLYQYTSHLVPALHSQVSQSLLSFITLPSLGWAGARALRGA